MTPHASSYREVHLTQGKIALVDAADYAWISRYKWHAVFNKERKVWYAARCAPKASGHYGRKIFMHREILGLGFGDPLEGDHVESGQTLDNRRMNLRTADSSQQQANSRLQRDSVIRFKGVSASGNRFRARIVVRGVIINLGSFGTPEEAHGVYCEAAKKEFGSFWRKG